MLHVPAALPAMVPEPTLLSADATPFVPMQGSHQVRNLYVQMGPQQQEQHIANMAPMSRELGASSLYGSVSQEMIKETIEAVLRFSDLPGCHTFNDTRCVSGRACIF